MNEKEIIDLVTKEIGMLVKSFGFNLEARKSQENIKAETVEYRNSNILLKIVACLDVRDYPYYLSVYFHNIKKNYSFLPFIELLNSENKYFLPICNDFEITESVKKLSNGLEIILREKLYNNIKQM